MRIFQAMGLEKEIGELSVQGEKIGFTNGHGWKLFEQDLTVVPRHNGWFNNQFFNQPRLEKCLREGVARYPNVTIRLGWALSEQNQFEDAVTVQLTSAEETKEPKTESVVARYVLACDGASSSIRKALEIPQEDLRCDEPWLVCDLMLDDGQEFDRTGLQICDPARPTTLIPCAGSHIRWEFMLNAEDEFSSMEEEEAVRSLMAPHLWRLSPTLTKTDGDLVRAKVYNFHALIAKTFQQNRVFLLGDAAHQTPPFLGQGLCAGVRDAYNLCWKLIDVLNEKHSSELLETYTSERRPHVQEVINTAVKHGGVIQARNPLKAFVRDCYLMLGRVFPILVSFLKFGEGWNLGSGLFALQERPESGGPVGEPLPQGRVQRLRDGEPGATVWSDDLLGDDYTLLGFGVDPSPLACEYNECTWLRCLHIGVGGVAREVEGELMNWAEEHDISLVLVRPDRQVYGVCKHGSEMEITQMLDTLYQRRTPNT